VSRYEIHSVSRVESRVDELTPFTLSPTRARGDRSAHGRLPPVRFVESTLGEQPRRSGEAARARSSRAPGYVANREPPEGEAHFEPRSPPRPRRRRRRARPARPGRSRGRVRQALLRVFCETPSVRASCRRSVGSATARSAGPISTSGSAPDASPSGKDRRTGISSAVCIVSSVSNMRAGAC
jgi:hypothetical protein